MVNEEYLNDELENTEFTSDSIVDYLEPTEPDMSFTGDPVDRQRYVIIFDDGTTIHDAWINGDYYVTEETVTEDMLSEENLFTVTVRSNGQETVYHNLENTDLHKFEGKYYFIIKEPTVKDAQYEELSAKIDYIAMMGGWDV